MNSKILLVIPLVLFLLVPTVAFAQTDFGATSSETTSEFESITETESTSLTSVEPMPYVYGEPQYEYDPFGVDVDGVSILVEIPQPVRDPMVTEYTLPTASEVGGQFYDSSIPDFDFESTDSDTDYVQYWYMTQTDDSIQVNTLSGKVTFDKSNGAMTIFANLEDVEADGTAEFVKVNSDSFVVRGAPIDTDNWFNLSVNDSPVTYTIDEREQNVVVTFTKTNSEGTFDLVTEVYNNSFKSTAYFSNSSFTDHKFAFTETVALPDSILKLNSQDIDLSLYIGQSFPRAVLEDNMDLVLEVEGLGYHSGVGFDNLWQVNIHENNTVSLDYANVGNVITPIGGMVELDPSWDWSKYGTGDIYGNMYSYPMSIGQFANGDFIVCSTDASYQGCHKYDKGGDYINTFTTATNPTAIHIDEANGEVWTNSYAQNVKKFDLNGNMLLSSFGGNSMGIDIFVDSDDNLWMSNFGTGISKYDSSRNLVFGAMTSFGGDSCGNQCQAFFAEDLDGNIWVSMSYKHKLYKIDKAGNHLLTVGGTIQTVGAGLTYPNHIDIDKNTGNLWVVAEFTYGAMEFDKYGNFLQRVGGQTTGMHSTYPAGLGYEDGKFKDPMGLSVYDGKLYIVDYLAFGANEAAIQRIDIGYPEPDQTPSYISSSMGYGDRFAIYDASYGAGTQTACSGSTTWAKQTGNQPLYQVMPASTTNTNSCYMAGTQFPLANIPSDAIITDVSMKFNINTSPNNPPTCDFVHMATNNGDIRASSVSATDIYNEITSTGTTLARDDSSCSGEVGDAKSVNLGTNGIVQLQNSLDNNHTYFAVGQKVSNDTRTANNIEGSYINQTLLVSYTEPPTATTLTATYNNGNADLSWTTVTDGAPNKIISPVAKQYTAGTTNLSDGLGDYGIRSPVDWTIIYDMNNVVRAPTAPTTSQSNAVLGSSVFFNGISDVLGHDSISGGSPNLTDKASVSVWIKPMGSPYVSGGASAGNPLALMSNGGEIYFVQNGQWASYYPLDSFNVGSVYSNGNAFNMYEWNHLVISGDSSSSANLSTCPSFWTCVMELDVYMNGQKVQMYSYPSGTGGGTATNATEKSVAGTFSNFVLGAQYHPSPLFKYPFHGYIDEFANWNTTLTQADVTALYNDGKGNLPSVANKNSNLVNYLPLDDESFPIQNNAIRDINDVHSDYIVTPTAYDALKSSGTSIGNPFKNVEGIYGSAWEFSGQYTKEHVNDVWVQFPNERSISQWFNFELADYGYTIGGNSMGELSTQANGGGYSWSGAIPAGTFSNSTWHHVVQTKDVNNNTKLYVDGTQILTGSLTWATMTTPKEFCIGISGCGVIASGGSTHDTSKGMIDEIAMYERELTSSEVTALYNSGKSAHPTAISVDGLTHYFNFEQLGDQLTNMAVVKDPTLLSYDVIKDGTLITTTTGTTYSDPISATSIYTIDAGVGQKSILTSLHNPSYYAPAANTHATNGATECTTTGSHSSWVWYSSNYVPWFGTWNGCRVSGYEWDVSSIPDSATILDVDVEYDIGFAADAPLLKWTSQEQSHTGTNPYTSSTDAWNDAHNNNGINRNGITYASHQMALTTGMKDLSLDLGEVAREHVKAQLTDATSVNGVGDWFGMYSPFVTDGDHSGTLKRLSTANVELNVTYAMDNSATSNSQTVIPPPPAPTNISATVNAPNVDLSWASSTGATGYKIETSTNGTLWTNIVANTSPTSAWTWDASQSSAISVSGSTITNSASGNGWSNYIRTSETVNASTGGGSMSFKFPNGASNSQESIGFGKDPLSANATSYNNIEYAMTLLNTTTVQMWQSGAHYGNFTLSGFDPATSVFRIDMDGSGNVSFYHNNTLIRTSAQTASGDYYIHATIYTGGNSIVLLDESYTHTAPVLNTTNYYQVYAISSAGTSGTGIIFGVPSVDTTITLPASTYPSGVATDSSGNTYVSLSSLNQIAVYDSSGTLQNTYGAGGAISCTNSAVNFGNPKGISVDSNGDIWVAEHSCHRVQKLDSSGNHLFYIGNTPTGTQGYTGSGFAYPYDVDFDSNGNAYVVDTGNAQISKYSSGGTFISQFLAIPNGSGNYQSVSPEGIAIDSDGDVYVADRYNHRVSHYDSSGTYIDSIGTTGIAGSTNSDLSNPQGVDVDADDNVYIADASNKRVQKFDSSGNYVTSTPTGSKYYNDVAIDSYNIHVVSDERNAEIYSQVGGIAVGGTPDAPTGLSATFNTTTVDMDLAWTAPSNNNGSAITGYKIEVSTDGTNFTDLTADTGSITTTHIDLNPTMGSLNYYKVSAINAYGVDAVSNIDNDMAGLPADAPTITTAIPNPNTAPLDIVISITNGASNGTGTITNYEIYRDSTLVATTGVVSSYTDTVPSGGGTFAYEAKTVTDHGTSALSSSVSQTTPTPPPAPTSAPTLDIANPNPSPFDVTVTFAMPSSGGSAINSFEIFRSTDDILFTSVGTTTTLIFSDTVPNAGTFYYKFASTNLVGNSGQSPSSSIATPTVPDASSVTLSINDPNTLPLVITATPIAGGTGGSAIIDYNLEYSDDGSNWTQISTGLTGSYDYTVATAGTHYFQTQARNNVGVGTLGSTISIATPTVPDAPTVTLAINDPDNLPFDITATFVAGGNGGSNIIDYNLEYSSDGVLFVQVASGVTGSYTHTVSTAGTHYFQATARNAVGDSLIGTVSNMDTPTVPTAPQTLTATTIDTANIELNWTLPASDGGSIIQSLSVQSDATGSFAQIATVGAGILTYTDTGLTNATNYNYQIVAVNNVGSSNPSNTDGDWTLPNAPVGLVVTTTPSNSSLELSWTYPTGTVTQYSIERALVSDGVYTESQSPAFATVCSVATCTATDTGLTSGSEYQFRIYASNLGGESTVSNISSNWTLNDIPTGLTVTLDTNNSSNSYLTWNIPSGTVTGFQIERETPVGGGWIIDEADTGLVSSYTDTGLTLTTEYNYRISAINLGGTTVASPTVSTTTHSPPDAPTDITFDLQSISSVLRVQVDWVEPVNLNLGTLTGYMVERNDGTGWNIIANTGTNPAIIDTDIQRGVNYEYRVSTTTNVATGIPSVTNSLEFVEGTFTLPLTAVQGNTLESQSTFIKTHGDPVSYATKVLIVKHDPFSPTITTVASSTSLLTSALGTSINGVDVGIELTSGTILLDSQYVYETSEYTYTGYLTTVQDGITYLFESASITVTPLNPFGGDTFAEESRDILTYQTSTVELYAEPAGYDAVIRYQHQDPTIPPFFYGTMNVQSNATFVSPVLDDKDFYVSVYVNPEKFDFIIDNPTTGLAHIECNEDSPLNCPAWDAVYTPSGIVTHSLNPTYGALDDIPDGIQSDYVTKSFKSPDAPAGFGLEPLGDLFGMPLIFIFVIGLGAVFTGRSAQMGVIFISVTLGIMLYLGYISFDFGTSGLSTAVTWGIIIIAMIGGILVGKRWS